MQLTQEFIDNYLWLIFFGILFAIGLIMEVVHKADAKESNTHPYINNKS